MKLKKDGNGNGVWTIVAFVAIVPLLLLRADPARGAVMAPIVGEIERISLDNPADVWSGGRIVAGGDNVVIPRNLLIDLPANRLTLQQLFAQAPPSCLANGETGLAKADRCNIDATGGLATIFANRTGGGNVIAGDVRIAKAVEIVTGVVTYISFVDGYFRLNGIPGDAATGVMVRVNDPTGRHTIQQGVGCAPGNTENCSADGRFAIDFTNYTFAFATGYPPCIPSVANGANAVTGAGDPFCPSTNRPGHPSPDATRFAPVLLGDSLSATGNFERVGGVQFLSAHTVKVFADITTQDLPTQPDYMIFNEVGWDAPPYPGSRVKARFLGATSLHDSKVDIFSVHYDNVNVPHEIPLETTVNNPGNGAVVFLGVPTGVFDTVLNVDFVAAVGPDPCPDLGRGSVAGISAFCSVPSPTLSQNFRLVSPIAREVVGRTRHKATLSPGVVTRDIRGNLSPNGQYLTPVGIEYPGMEDINLGKIQTPYSFSGVPWNLDRRLSPGGCVGPCEGTPQPLSPFPFEGIDPRTQSLRAPVPVPSRILSYYPFGPADVLAWPPADPAPIGIAPVESLALACDLLPTGATLSTNLPSPQIVGASVVYTGAATGGTGPYEYRFEGRVVGSPTWGLAQDYSSLDNWTWNTATVPTGSYEFRVLARNAGSTAASEAISSVVGFVLNLGTVTLSTNLASPQAVGASVVLTGAAGGTGPFEYRFEGRAVGSPTWAPAQDFSPLSTWTWNTGTVLAGSYEFRVLARTAGSTAAPGAISPVVGFVLTVGPPTVVTLSTNLPSPQNVGASVVFTGAATGGSGPYEYRFEGRAVGSPSWAPAQDFSPLSTWTWNTGTVPAGGYEFRVLARAAGSPAEVISPALGFTLQVGGVTLKAVPALAQFVGSAVTFTGTVTGGGTFTYEYQFWGRAVGAPSFSLGQDYGPLDTFTWNTATVPSGNYEWRVFARPVGSTASFEVQSAVVGYQLLTGQR